MSQLINEINNMRKLMGITEGVVPSVLYHGGGADFDQFDLSHVLGGAGVITHGYGVYLTADKSVAERYALNSVGRKGFIYTVRAYNIDTLLGWEEPIDSDIAQNIFNRYSRMTEDEQELEDMMDALGLSDGYYGQSMTSSLYSYLEAVLGGKKQATDLLLKSGVDGIYFRSNESGTDTINYVIFDEGNVKILDKEPISDEDNPGGYKYSV